jgi:hypothetical protein
MRPVILFRRGVDGNDDEEFNTAKQYLPVITQRTDARPGDLVIGRYSVLPFYKELEADLAHNGATLVNTIGQHQFIADMAQWVPVLLDIDATPPMYAMDRIPEKGPFVVKGHTNSKKQLWNTHMFAETKRRAVEIALELMQDTLIGGQQIYIRPFVPLRRLAVGLNELPINEEYRFFVFRGQIISGGFYWSSHIEDIPFPERSNLHPGNVPSKFLQTVVETIGDSAAFYVLDVARCASGQWMVVELNDGQMSGLSENDPHVLYSSLSEAAYAEVAPRIDRAW